MFATTVFATKNTRESGRSTCHRAPRQDDQSTQCNCRINGRQFHGTVWAGLLVFTFSGQDQFNNPIVVVIILVFVVSLPLQIYLINASLAVNDILYQSRISMYFGTLETF